VIHRFEPSLQPAHRESISYELSLEPEEVVDLITMSPSHRHLTEPVPPLSGPLDVTVAVEILAFRRGIEGSATSTG
jgi:methyl coenzyme M reductase subunit C